MRLTPALFLSSVALISGLTACPSTSDPTDDATVGAEMGSTDAETVQLHFEIRRQGKPVDPIKLLPPR